MRTTLITLLVVLGLTVSGCGSSNADKPTDTKAYDDADVAFATDMIPHHAQALSMIDLTVGRRLDPEVMRLIEDIRSAQTPEIETMAGWLEDWGKEVPETGRGHSMEGMDEHTTDMPGMMSDQEMAGLKAADGAAFRRMFLEMMIRHHQGAIAMARDEQEDGKFPDAVSLAQSIEKGQSSEINTMERLLAG